MDSRQGAGFYKPTREPMRGFKLYGGHEHDKHSKKTKVRYLYRYVGCIIRNHFIRIPEAG